MNKMKTKTIPLKNYKKYRHLRDLVNQWTRAEVMARSPAVGFPECAEYDQSRRELEDQIRILLFGTSNLIEIGEKLGLPVHVKKKRE